MVKSIVGDFRESGGDGTQLVGCKSRAIAVNGTENSQRFIVKGLRESHTNSYRVHAFLILLRPISPDAAQSGHSVSGL
jgi:hypothetical protein